MKVTAVNASPRTTFNTAVLLKEALSGASAAGAEILYFDLYRQEKFTGCISCFGCKRKPNEGRCIYSDGIYPILQAIRESDAVIIGTPNYLGQPSAGFIALYERLVFQNLTYQKEKRNYNEADKPVLFIMTSNVPEEGYKEGPYAEMIRRYSGGLSSALGPVSVYLCGDTLQVNDYSLYNWTYFDPEKKKKRHEEVFPEQKKEVFELGRKLAEEAAQ